MIIEDEYKEPEIFHNMEFDNYDGDIVLPSYTRSVGDFTVNQTESAFANVLSRMKENHNKEVHYQLHDDLKEYLFLLHEQYKKL